MRIIAGERGGFHLKGPPSRATRPMTDKIKSAVFSMLASLGSEPDRVLDLYAGTGGLGIEALSRGALHAEFVEQAGAAVAVIRANLAHTGYADASLVHQLPVATFIARATAGSEPFDLVFADPPYADDDIVTVLESIGESALIQSGSMVVLGHWPRLTPPDRAGRLGKVRGRCHGDSCFTVYEWPPDDDEPVALSGPVTDSDQE